MIIDKSELFNQIRQGNLQAIEEESEQELLEYQELEMHFKEAVRNCMKSGFTNFLLVSWTDEDLLPASYVCSSSDIEMMRDIIYEALNDVEKILEET